MSDETTATILHFDRPTAAPTTAVRGELAESTLTVSDFGTLGLFASCPGCGLGSDRLRPYVTVDHLHDRALRLVGCGACGRQDGCDLRAW
ncbi:hypothetical protein [Streptomyces sp. NPDC005538]|uniref:hypothetical protein n=1 Tax=unclassified Streptomyces TaxID=2593676 RepID=UPI0033A7B805